VFKGIALQAGVLNDSGQDHYGFNQHGRVMLIIEIGNWKLLK
jgi:branched-chain amino acid transport system substrate-binding protein